MNSEKLLERLALAIFAILGASLLVIAYVASTHALVSNILLSLGVILLSVAAITWMWRISGGDPITRGLKGLHAELSAQANTLTSLFDILGDSDRAGLVRFFDGRDTIPPELEWDLLANATKRIDLCGRSLFGWISNDDERFARSIRERVRKGCRVRILLYKPYLEGDPVKNSPFTSDGDLERVRRDEVTNSHTKKALKYYLQLKEELGQNAPRFEVKVLTKTMYVLLSRFDDSMLIAPYVAHTLSPKSPHVLVRRRATGDRRGDLFSFMTVEFDALWKAGEFPEGSFLELLRADTTVHS